MALLKQATAVTRMFKMIDSSDHLSKKAGLTCTVNISKAGAAFGAAAGAVTEVANGWYKVALTTVDTGTLGDLAFYITATGADDTDFCDQVTAAVDQTGDAYARLGAPAGASHAADVAAVKSDTGGIKTQTDKMAFTVTNQIDANVLDWKSSAAPAMTGDAFARLGAPAGASHAADVAAVKSDTGTILTDVNTGAGAIYTRLGAPAGASIAADVAAVKSDTGSMAATIWNALTSGMTTVGSIGKLLATNIDALISSRSTYAGGAVASVTGAVGSVTGLNAALVDAAISSRLAASSYTPPDNADIAAIKAKTDNLPASPADEALIIAATNSLASSIAALPNTTTVNAIKSKTDSLNFSVSGQVDSNVASVNGHAVTGDGHTGTEWGPA